ncbi:MAG: hypothetical protein A2991_00095 [Candidatus Terrybacteria bacterium RIFCSPLOWO2_01_FULL_58_14]|uniref:PDZ domain-containing protein n=2 Tax=Candidatus Terryibacteriota TaxID=1817920 RepID=A0A1G2PYL3_9BACT|nr:MAG: hypothetical protein A2682_01070 [Candidatus Terrybacteria bacterium RIFCSPHIGHO2_01_FULL_58_15]OHA53393.1 MAG: hypothetical protein A2991_00095 [Candidatus Terrybacteria bacterium RIFCSPLOWO2_01_FULL_58_14]
MKKILAIIVVVFLVGGAGFALGLAAGWGSFGATFQPPPSTITELLWETYDVLRDSYIAPEELSDEKLLYGAIRGLVEAAGDPYTEFFAPEEARLFLEDASGHFEGIGAEIGFRDRVLTVIAPLKGSPASTAGLLSGDAILAIDDVSTARMTLAEAVSRIRGGAGSSVVLEIFREGQESSFDATVTRARITIPTIELDRRPDGIAVVQLFNFSEDSPQLFRELASELASDPPAGLVLDLRDNPGGYLDAAVDIAGWFLENDAAVVIERQRGEDDNILRTDGSGALAFLPTVVLINRGTASAAEILAGALRDNRAVPLIGETSFGKGTIQELPRLSGGAALKVTIGEWLTPKGASLRENGLEPDIAIGDDPATPADEGIEKAAATLLVR